MNSNLRRLTGTAMLAASLLGALASPALGSEHEGAKEPETCENKVGLELSRCRLQGVRGEAGFGTATDPVAVAGGIIKTLLSILGILFVGLTIYGGYLWMTARGDEQLVTKGKNTIERAVTGLIIVLAAYAITFFVIDALTSAANSVAPGA